MSGRRSMHILDNSRSSSYMNIIPQYYRFVKEAFLTDFNFMLPSYLSSTTCFWCLVNHKFLHDLTLPFIWLNKIYFSQSLKTCLAQYFFFLLLGHIYNSTLVLLFIFMQVPFNTTWYYIPLMNDTIYIHMGCSHALTLIRHRSRYVFRRMLIEDKPPSFQKSFLCLKSSSLRLRTLAPVVCSSIA